MDAQFYDSHEIRRLQLSHTYAYRRPSSCSICNLPACLEIFMPRFASVQGTLRKHYPVPCCILQRRHKSYTGIEPAPRKRKPWHSQKSQCCFLSAFFYIRKRRSGFSPGRMFCSYSALVFQSWNFCHRCFLDCRNVFCTFICFG